MLYVFVVQNEDISKRLDLFIHEQNVLESRNTVQNLIKKKQILVNGKESKPSYKMLINDKVTVLINEEEPVIINPENIALNIIYEDDNMLVVNKPKNMLTHPTSKETTGTLVNALLYKYGYKGLSDVNGVLRPGILHRLDRNTSGLLMVAKNNKAHDFLTEQIKNKTAIRKYLAVVRGNLNEKEGLINFPIARSVKYPEKMDVTENGKPSLTKYSVIEQFSGYSFLELTLFTGRTHQIRVHLSHIGHPVVNDSLYNKEKFKVKTQEQVLQAYKLQFTEMDKGDIINLEIPIDNDIEKVLKYLRSLR